MPWMSTQEEDARQTSSEGGLLSFSPGHHCVKCDAESSNMPKCQNGNRKATGKEGKGNVSPDRSCSDQEGVTLHITEQNCLRILLSPRSQSFWWTPLPPSSLSPYPPLSFLPPSHSLCPASSGHSLLASSRFLFFSSPTSLLPLPTSLHPSVSFSAHSGEVGDWKYSWYNFSFFHF